MAFLLLFSHHFSLHCVIFWTTEASQGIHPCWDGQGDPGRSHFSSLWFSQAISFSFFVVHQVFYISEGDHKHWHFLAGSVPHKSTQVMPNRTSMAWPKPWNAQQDITAHQEQGLPTSTRVQRAPTATSPGWQTPGTAGPVLGAHSVPGQVGIVCG